MPLEPSQLCKLMCLTQDRLPIGPVEQAERLCSSGARWIQLRMKGAPLDAWIRTARSVVGVCRAHGAVCIVNDSLEAALESGADGVHLGKGDADWAEARRRVGRRLVIGGTVNDSADARRAVAAGCLDYAGVGPLRLTATKENLAPVLGFAGVCALIRELGGLPAWVIGGVETADAPALLAAGAAGIAVASALYRNGRIEDNVLAFLAACASVTHPPFPSGAPSITRTVLS